MRASLRINAAVKHNKTSLQTGYCTPPFKIANITEDKSDPSLHLMLMSSSPGILDGDEYNLQIEVQNGGNLHLHTQSYQRLFTMQGQAAQTMNVHLHENSSFTYLPHPTVPHVRSSFTSRNTISLSNNCKLIWGEIVTCGRSGRDEPFSFTKFQSITKLYLLNRLVIKENLLIIPGTGSVTGLGMLEGFTHQSSFLYLDEHINADNLVQQLHEILQQFSNISFGVTSLPVTGILVRLLGYKAEQLFGIHHKILQHLHKPAN